jgi:hypothetical protein
MVRSGTFTAFTTTRVPSLPLARQYADFYVSDTDLGAATGSVIVNSGGDFQGATPIQSLRSRVIRMFASPPNGYRHLFEWGAKMKIGVLARPSELARMQLQAQRMLMQDPDVASVRVKITNPIRVNGQTVNFAGLVEVRITARGGDSDTILTTLDGTERK